MKVKSLETTRNAYDQVLFLEGHEYKATKTGNTYHVLNELHTETPFKERALKKFFQILEADLEINLTPGKKYWCEWMHRNLWYKGRAYNGKDYEFEDAGDILVTLGANEVNCLEEVKA